MPAKKKCQAQIIVSSPPLPASSTTSKPLPATDASRDTVDCNKAAQRIVGDCGFCGKSFCGNHRLPEQHGCVKLQACRDAAHAANKAKLEAERTVAPKIAFT